MATRTDALASKTIDGVMETRVEHLSGLIPRYANHLCTCGEVGKFNIKTTGTPKVEDRGIAMMFVGYAMEHEGGVYRMYNPKAKRLVTTRDIIWLSSMWYTESQDLDLTMEPSIVMEIYSHLELLLPPLTQ